MPNNESSEAEKGDQVDESDTDSDHELKDSIIRQTLVGRRMAVLPTNPVVAFPYISGALRPMPWIPDTALELAQSFGKFLPNLAKYPSRANNQFDRSAKTQMLSRVF
jgi:hypothetical protein